MDPLNFLKETSKIVAGGVGFRRDKLIDVGSAFRDSAGLLLTGVSSPLLVATGVSFDDTDTAYLWLTLPNDYDEGDDHLILNLSAGVDDAAATGTLSVDEVFLFRAGADPAGADQSITVSDVTVAANVEQLVSFDLSGNGFLARDVLRVQIGATNSGIPEVIVKGGWMEYKSALVAYDPDNR